MLQALYCMVKHSIAKSLEIFRFAPHVAKLMLRISLCFISLGPLSVYTTTLSLILPCLSPSPCSPSLLPLSGEPTELAHRRTLSPRSLPV